MTRQMCGPHFCGTDMCCSKEGARQGNIKNHSNATHVAGSSHVTPYVLVVCVPTRRQGLIVEWPEFHTLAGPIAQHNVHMSHMSCVTSLETSRAGFGSVSGWRAQLRERDRLGTLECYSRTQRAALHTVPLSLPTVTLPALQLLRAK